MITITTVPDAPVETVENVSRQKPVVPTPATAVDVAGLREVVDGLKDHLDLVDRQLSAAEAATPAPHEEPIASLAAQGDDQGEDADVAADAEKRQMNSHGGAQVNDVGGAEILLGNVVSFGPPDPSQQALYLSPGFAVVELSNEQRARLEAFRRVGQVDRTGPLGEPRPTEAAVVLPAPAAADGQGRRRLRR